jgi:hypothetical protein
MARTGNYAAFYVSEPFSSSNLGANATKDFIYYNQLKAWSSLDNDFKFVDSHDKNYNVRDGSDWELTLKPRLRNRISQSKNIILFLSSKTKESKALREEIDYAVNVKGLPIIIIYPEFSEESEISNGSVISSKVKLLWDKLPILKSSINKVPTIHVPYKKDLIKLSLSDPDFMVGTKINGKKYFYKY